MHACTVDTDHILSFRMTISSLCCKLELYGLDSMNMHPACGVRKDHCLRIVNSICKKLGELSHISSKYDPAKAGTYIT